MPRLEYTFLVMRYAALYKNGWCFFVSTLILLGFGEKNILIHSYHINIPLKIVS